MSHTYKHFFARSRGGDTTPVGISLATPYRGSHEASPLWMGKDPASSVVGLDYRPHGVNNVYVMGASIFPTSGSWNPTLTMCGLAQDLADRLS